MDPGSRAGSAVAAEVCVRSMPEVVRAVCCHMGMTKRWGPWRLSNDGQFLEYRWDGSVHDSALYRKLDLYRCTTAAEVLDTIFHEAGAAAAEADDAYLAGLVRALDDLLHPMANLCSGGKGTTLSRVQLVEILGQGGAR